MRLPKWSFLSRFRLRIMFQNMTNYLILFVGIWFIGIMLAMAVGMPETLDYYKIQCFRYDVHELSVCVKVL